MTFWWHPSPKRSSRYGPSSSQVRRSPPCTRTCPLSSATWCGYTPSNRGYR